MFPVSSFRLALLFVQVSKDVTDTNVTCYIGLVVRHVCQLSKRGANQHTVDDKGQVSLAQPHFFYSNKCVVSLSIINLIL